MTVTDLLILSAIITVAILVLGLAWSVVKRFLKIWVLVLIILVVLFMVFQFQWPVTA